MIKVISILITILFYIPLISQEKEVCETPTEDVLLDVNSITKCSIESAKDKSNTGKKTFTVQVSSRRRVKRKKQVASSSLNSIKSNDINEVKGNSSIVGNLYLDKEKVIEKVPFDHVEEIPLFEACKKVSLLSQKKCFKKEINKHILNNLKYPEEAHRKSIQGRVLVQFVIDKDGKTTDLNIRTPYQGELLREEAKRIISTLPNFIPGKHHGKVVKVKYGVPISFKIPGREPLNVKKPAKNIDLKEIYNFTNVDVMPAFEKCANSNDSSEDCFNKLFIDHMNNNFEYPLEAVKNNIEGKVIIYFVIDANGQVVNIKTRAGEGKEILEQASKELVEKLPIFIPGKHQGKKTNVSHVFPIVFKLNDEASL